VKSVRQVKETELAEIAKRVRQKAGKTRAQAARDMGIRQTSIFHAEESPEKSYTKLRIRMIETYSRVRITGPVFIVEEL
jgi:DNA-binding XRE family transcriptional regulator